MTDSDACKDSITAIIPMNGQSICQGDLYEPENHQVDNHGRKCIARSIKCLSDDHAIAKEYIAQANDF